MALLPVDVRALYGASKRFTEDRDRPVRIAIIVEVDAPDALVEAARDAFHPKSATGIVDVAVIETGSMVRASSSVDAAVLLVGSGANVAETLKDLRERAIPTAVLALREDRAETARLIGHPENDTLVGEDPETLLRGAFADWAMRRLDKPRTALGHNFAFMRRAVAKEIVQKTAWQNAAVGLLLFVPGADMPVMTLNQGKMLLQIAAAYGEPMDSERIKELGAVVAGGFLFRQFARELLGLLPAVGWVVKGGIAYTGTVAMGAAAIRYFEEGADLGGVVQALTEKAHDAADYVAQHARERRGSVDAVLDYVPTVESAPAPALPEAAAEAGDAPLEGPTL